MAAVSPCVPCCTTPQTTAVPGPEGPTGPAGPGTVTEVTASDGFLAVATGTTTPDLTLSGTLPADHGGTGQNSLANAWTALYSAGGALPIANGGTGNVTAAAALAALGGAVIPEAPIQSTTTGSASLTVGATPGARVLTSDVTLTKDGTWLLILTAHLTTSDFNGNATHNFNTGIYRTNNTPGLVTGGTITTYWGADNVVASGPSTFEYSTKLCIYTTANANDNFHVYGWQTNAASAGTMEVVMTDLIAIFLKD